MPVPKFTGDRLPIGSVSPRQVVANPATKQASPPIQPDRYTRNGQQPSAQLINALNEAGNQSAMYRSKEVFAFARSRFDALSTIRDWRFAFHTGSYTHTLLGIVHIDPPVSGSTVNSYITVTIYSDTAEAVTVGSTDFVFGAIAAADVGFNNAKLLLGYIEGVAPDTAYYGKVSVTAGGLPMGISIVDLPSMTENAGGYLAENVTAYSSVLDVHRQNLVTVSNALWRRCGSRVLSWTVEDGAAPITTTSATATNIINNSSTTITSATPGFTIDMTGKARIGQTSGVPCIMKAYGRMSAGTNGAVYIKDSAGNTVASIAAAWGTSASWQTSASFNLPASSAKYDLMYSTTAGTFSLHAISIYELG